jgi:hypothetical protein
MFALVCIGTAKSAWAQAALGSSHKKRNYKSAFATGSEFIISYGFNF